VPSTLQRMNVEKDPIFDALIIDELDVDGWRCVS
jgi:hypothetical protein